MVTTVKVLVFLLLLSTVSLSAFYLHGKKKGHCMAIDPKKTIFLIDGSGFLYRAYYGLKPMHTIKGIPIQAVYSFCRMIKKLVDTFDPHYIALVWDSKGLTVRHEIFPAYKATRTAPPSDLFDQKKYIQAFADLIGLKQFERPGIEADDILFSLAVDFANENNDVVIITSDKDMSQTLTDRITIFDPFKDVFIDREAFAQRMEFPVEKLAFYFSLLGDTSDNIPGVKGIGQKTATTLVQQFASLTDLYEHIDQIAKEGVRRSLEENKKNAFLSEELFLLRYLSFGSTKEELSFDKKNWIKAQPIFEELGFKSLLKGLEKDGIQAATKVLLSESKGYIFKVITNAAELLELLEQARAAKNISVDTELDGLNPLLNKVVGFSFCFKKGEAYYVPFGHQDTSVQLSQAFVMQALQSVLCDSHVEVTMHSANFDIRALHHAGCATGNLKFDTLLAAHLVTEDWQRISLKAISEFYLDEPMLTFADVVIQKDIKIFHLFPLTKQLNMLQVMHIRHFNSSQF